MPSANDVRELLYLILILACFYVGIGIIGANDVRPPEILWIEGHDGASDARLAAIREIGGPQ